MRILKKKNMEVVDFVKESIHKITYCEKKLHCATIALRKTKNYIEKAMTETVVVSGTYRESSIWWKLFMQKGT